MASPTLNPKQTAAPKGPITLQDVADRVGVSLITASRILNGNAQYTRPTFARRAERVRRVADELGYRPNIAARAMSQGSFGSISMLLASQSRPLWLPAGLIRGLTRAANDRDLRLMVSELPDAKLGDRDFAPQVLKELSVDGLILDYLHEMPAQLSQLLHDNRVPVIYLNDRRENDCVYFDDQSAARDVVKDLASIGHRRIAYFGPVPNADAHYSRIDRHHGYASGMDDAGLTPMPWLFPYAELPDRRAWLRDQLTGPDAPTAILCYGETFDNNLIGAALRAGISIPDRLSVVTFNNEKRLIADQPIDCLLLPQKEIAEIAVDAVVQKISRPQHPLTIDPVPFSSPASEGSVAPPSV